MSERIEIKIVDLPGFLRAWGAAPARLTHEMGTAARRIALRGHAVSTAHVPRRTGVLAGSIYQRSESAAGGARAIFGASAEYALPVDRGRRAGARQPPVDAIMASMGVDRNAAFLIARAIGRRGIAAKPFVSRAFAELRAGVAQREFAAAVRRAIGGFGGGG